MADDEAQVQVSFYVPDDQEAGTYANSVTVWHTSSEFTIDSAATQPVQAADPEDESTDFVVPARVQHFALMVDPAQDYLLPGT
jgi:hypothetical protein